MDQQVQTFAWCSTRFIALVWKPLAHNYCTIYYCSDNMLPLNLKKQGLYFCILIMAYMEMFDFLCCVLMLLAATEYTSHVRARLPELYLEPHRVQTNQRIGAEGHSR